MAKRIKKTSRLVNHLYLYAFLGVAALTALQCSYLEGRATVAVNRYHDIHRQIDREQINAQYWRSKYDSLSHEKDWLTVVDAEAKYQRARR
jgi:alpha-glucuronidase